MQKKIFKKLMAASLAAVMTVGLAACGNEAGDESGSSNPGQESGSNGEDNSTPDTPDTPDTPGTSDEGDVSAYPVITDPATGEPYDLGGINVVIYSWFTDGTSDDDYGEALEEYHEWLTETYNFTLERQQLGGWGDCPQALVDYVTTGGDDNYYIF